MPSRVYVLVLNWNGWSETIDCLESVLRSEDLVGEMLRGVRLGGGKAGLTDGWAGNRCPALVAELGPCRQVRPARTTREAKASPALQTEARARRILVLAPRTLHAALRGRDR